MLLATIPDLPEPQPLLNRANYRITDADRLGEGSLKRKCRDNLAAIELQRLQGGETAAATP